MFTRERPARAVPGSPAPTPYRFGSFLHDVPSLLVLCVVAALVCAFFAAFYFAKHFTQPIGWDTARYLDQTQLVIGKGLRGVADVHLPRPSQTLSSRVGFPVTVLTLSRLFGGTTFEAATVVPIAAIAATSLAAGALVSFTLRRSVWEASAVALFIGLSTSLVRLIGGTYTDNLLAAALFAAALVPLATSVTEGRGFLAAIVLFGVGGFVHTAFFGFSMIVLAVVFLAYLPASWTLWRSRDAGLLATPSARVGLVVAGSGAVAGFGIYGLLATAPAQTDLSREEFATKLRQDLPMYRFPLTAPVAAVGVAGLAAGWRAGAGAGRRPAPSRPGFLLILVLAWGVVTAGGVGLYYLGHASPAHRFLAFLLPFPICVALAFLWVGRAAARHTIAVVGVAVVVAGVALTAALAHSTLFGSLNRLGVEYLDDGKVQDASTAQAYLAAAGVPEAAPVVYVIDDTGPNPQEFLPEEAHMLRTVMTATRIEHAYFYLGSPDTYLRGAATLRPADTRHFNVASRRFFRGVEGVLPHRPVALLLAAYNPAYRAYARAHPEERVAFNVVALNGPGLRPPLASPPFPSIPRGFFRFAAFMAATLVALVLIGAGWALALLPRGVRPFEAFALSMSFGFAFLVVGGAALDVAGFRLVGATAALTGPAVGVLGWAIAALRARGRGLPFAEA